MKKTLIVAAVLTLSGCGEKGAGVGVTSAESSTTEQAGLIERVKSMLFDKSTTASIEIPVSPLILQAISDYGLQGEFAGGAALLFCPKSLMGGIAEVDGSLSDPGMGAKAYEAMFDVVQYRLDDDDKRTMAAAIERLKHLDRVEAQKLCLANLVDTAITPVMGWEPARGQVSQQDMFRRTAEMAAVGVLATNYVATQIAGQIAKQVYSDPDAIKSMTLKIMDDLAKKGEIAAAFAQAAKDWNAVKNTVSFDMTGSSPAKVHFIAGQYDFAGDGAGYKLSQSGTVWFGGGYLSGKKYDVGVVRTVSASMGKSSTTTDSQSGSATSGSDAGVSVGK